MPSPDFARRRVVLLAASLVLGAALAGGCRLREDDAPAAETTVVTSFTDSAPRHPPGYVVDSVLPAEEALRRFREGVPRATRLEGGAPSRARLVTDFARALERGDSAALRRMEVTKGEFAYLVYPSSIYAHPPYEQQPEIVWMLQRLRGDAGLRRLMERYGGRPLKYRGHSCAAEPMPQGDNRLWRDCVVRYTRAGGDTATGRLFGVILQRRGRFKFINYSNDL